MNSQLTAFVTLACTSGVFSLFLCFYVIVKRHLFTDIANRYIWNAIAGAIYSFGSAFGLLATSLEQIKFWTVVLYIGMSAAPPLGLLFVMHYLGFRIKRKHVVSLLIIPFISLVLVATNDWHHLHYRIFELDPIRGAPYIHLEIGVWYAVHGVYTFSCMFVAFMLILFRWKETDKAYRPQLIALMFGQLVPMVTAFAYLIGMTPTGIDPVPVVLWLTSIMYLIAINSSRMFSLTPIAKDTIFHGIHDGVIVLDETHRMVEFNETSKRMFPQLDKAMFGLPFERVWFELTGESDAPPLSSEPFDWKAPSPDGTKRIYQVTTSPLRGGGHRGGLLLLFSDMTEIRSLQERLERQAYYDELTGILNRRAFFLRGEEVLEASKQAESPFSVVLFDIDHFKSVNDTHGHVIGDRMLAHVAKTCREALTEDILFARYGGEEFVLIVPGTAAEGTAMAERLRGDLAKRPLMTAAGALAVTVSCGIAEAAQAAGQDQLLQRVLQQADLALYEAKRQGRNRTVVWAG